MATEMAVMVKGPLENGTAERERREKEIREKRRDEGEGYSELYLYVYVHTYIHTYMHIYILYNTLACGPTAFAHTHTSH